MNIDDIKSEIQTKITNQTADNSITPESLGEVLSDMCDFAASASQETYSAITAEVADITTIKSQTVSSSTISVGEAKITSLSSTTISVGSAEIASLSSATINVENLIVDEITASTASISALSASTINGKDASEILFGNISGHTCLVIFDEDTEALGNGPEIGNHSADEFLNGEGEWAVPASSQGYSGSSTINVDSAKTISAKGYNYVLSGNSSIFEINKSTNDDGVKITNTSSNEKTSLKIEATGSISLAANSGAGGSGGSGISCRGNLNITTTEGRVAMSSQATAKVNGVSDVYLGCPIGTIVMWAGATAPSGWLLCDGSQVDETLETGTSHDYDFITNYQGQSSYWKIPSNSPYKNLLLVIKGIYTDSYVITQTSKAKLPDLQQRFPLGAKSDTDWRCGSESYNTNLGQTGGANEVTLTADESGLRSHGHDIIVSGYSRTDLAANVPGNQDTACSVNGSTQGNINYPVLIQDCNELDAQSAHNNIPPYLALNFIIKYQ